MLLDLKTLGPERYGHHFAHETFIFFKESLYIMIRISMEFVPKGPIDNRSALLFFNGLVKNRQQAIIWTHG